MRYRRKRSFFIAEHEAECFKELKRQNDEYLKRQKSCRVRGQKEIEKVKKDGKGLKAAEHKGRKIHTLEK